MIKHCFQPGHKLGKNLRPKLANNNGTKKASASAYDGSERSQRRINFQYHNELNKQLKFENQY